jgi:hypothetical protein
MVLLIFKEKIKIQEIQESDREPEATVVHWSKAHQVITINFLLHCTATLPLLYWNSLQQRKNAVPVAVLSVSRALRLSRSLYYRSCIETVSPRETRKTGTCPRIVIAYASPRAIAPRFVSVAMQRIRPRRTFAFLASKSPKAQVANAADLKIMAKYIVQ